MSLRVVAVVISNDQPNYLQNCLSAIERQSYRAERVLVVDTSTSEEVSVILQDFIKASSKHAVVNVAEKADFAELAALGVKQVLTGFSNLDDVAIWLVHDDSAPESHALAELARTLELSPLVGIASPKQLAVDNSKLIVQQGLTVTRTFKPFSIVNDELDQKQHDGMSDVLAVTSNAMLIRANLWAELGGFSLSAPPLAQDVELGIRAHQAGFRVVVVPTARVKHAELSIHNKRDKHWLGGSAKYALAKATNHLRISQFPLTVAFLYWLALPFISLIQIFWLMFVKRPDRIGFTLRANLWAFFTFRARVRDRHGISHRSLSNLFASRTQVRSRARLALEIAEQKSNLSAFDGSTARVASSAQLSFAASGGLWIMFALAMLSYQFFPLGAAASGGFALPLSDSWLALFANTGASYQHVGLGLAAPSDPFNWVLLSIGSLTFFSPNLAFSFVLVSAKALAFFGAWRLLSLVSVRNGIRIVLALIYAMLPAFTLAQTQGNYPSVIFSITLPWLLFSFSRAARVGISSSVRSTEQAWSWVAASSLLLAVAFACAPSTLLLLVSMVLVFAFLARKRIKALLVVPIPLIALSAPYVIYQLMGNQQPFGVLADPTIAFANERPELINSLIGFDPIISWCLVGLIGLASFGLLSSMRAVFGLWLFALLAVANLWLVGSIAFSFGGVGSIFLEQVERVYDSATPSAMFFAVAILLALAIWLDSILHSGFRKILVLASFVLVAMPLAYLSATSSSLVSFGDSRNLPALFTAETNQGSELRMLVISSDGQTGTQRFRAELVRSAGIRLDTISTAYRLSAANNEVDYSNKEKLAKLTANLVSANGQSLTKSLKEVGVGYILVPESSGNGDVQIALNTASELDQVGTTEFGQLWRVKVTNEITTDETKALWSITKSIQLSVLVGFILLAMPTSRGRKQRVSNEFAEPEEAQ